MGDTVHELVPNRIGLWWKTVDLRRLLVIGLVLLFVAAPGAALRMREV